MGLVEMSTSPIHPPTYQLENIYLFPTSPQIQMIIHKNDHLRNSLVFSNNKMPLGQNDLRKGDRIRLLHLTQLTLRDIVNKACNKNGECLLGDLYDRVYKHPHFSSHSE
jgi:hypothetical protein